MSAPLPLHYGIQFEGLRYTVTCALLSGALFSLCSLLLWRSHASPTFVRSLTAQVALFAWIGAYAVAGIRFERWFQKRPLVADRLERTQCVG
jgi:hypothetical protein